MPVCSGSGDGLRSKVAADPFSSPPSCQKEIVQEVGGVVTVSVGGKERRGDRAQACYVAADHAARRHVAVKVQSRLLQSSGRGGRLRWSAGREAQAVAAQGRRPVDTLPTVVKFPALAVLLVAAHAACAVSPSSVASPSGPASPPAGPLRRPTPLKAKAQRARRLLHQPGIEPPKAPKCSFAIPPGGSAPCSRHRKGVPRKVPVTPVVGRADAHH